ncbi:unnamed protein product [Hermetia illucens]|uniref:Uncharacterized protein n=1 Tax=Hermetia illucens TaxID=343691 RepID=A0A7R8UJN5_HERIL|nr:unnamed protein product [Hermetia illucens]
MLVNQLRKDFLKICGNPKIKRVLSRTKEILPPTPPNNNRGNSIHLTTIQKTILGFGSSLVSLYNPTRIDMLNCCAEILCSTSLQKILNDMKLDSVGRRILEEKPNICTIANAEKLIELPEKTFGFALGKFLMKHVCLLK